MPIDTLVNINKIEDLFLQQVDGTHYVLVARGNRREKAIGYIDIRSYTGHDGTIVRYSLINHIEHLDPSSKNETNPRGNTQQVS